MDDQLTLHQVNYPILAANVESSQIAGVEGSTVVNVKGKKVRNMPQEEMCYTPKKDANLKKSLLKIGIIGYVTEDTPQKSQPGPDTKFLPIIQSIR